VDTIHERDGQTNGRTPADSEDRTYAWYRTVKTEEFNPWQIWIYEL